MIPMHWPDMAPVAHARDSGPDIIKSTTLPPFRIRRASLQQYHSVMGSFNS